MSQVRINARLKNNLLCVSRELKENSTAENVTYGLSEPPKCWCDVVIVVEGRRESSCLPVLLCAELKGKGWNSILKGTLRVKSSTTFSSNYWKPWLSPDFKRNWIQEQCGGSAPTKWMNILQGKNWWCPLGALSLASPLGSENNVDPLEVSSKGQTFAYEIVYKREFPFLNSTQSLCRQFSQNFQDV